MKKILLITIAFATVSSCFISCSDNIESYNENPNAPEFVLPNTIFNSATKQVTDNLRNDFNSGRLDLNWMEYWGQNAYADEDRYAFRESSTQSIYQNSYLIATEFKTIIDINENEETAVAASAVGNNDNQIAASRIMLSFIFHRLVDFYGDVPYYSYGNEDPEFQALQIETVLSPVFASQEKIYTDILKELREAADMLNTSQPVFTTGDNIFNGDATKWKKFANSLILRVANRLKGVDAAAANTAINAALADGVMTSNSDNAVQAYATNDAGASPWWLAFLPRNDFAIAAPFVDLLKGNTGTFGPDERLFQYAAPKDVAIDDITDGSYEVSTDYDDYQGIPYAFVLANFLDFTSYSWPSNNVIKQDFGEVLMEYAEVAFIQSELSNWDQAQYENGVRASMEKWGVDATAVDAFVANLPAATEETVITQKYVALYMQAHEAYAEFRRTGFPSTDILFFPGETYNLPADQQLEDDQGNLVTSYTFVSAVTGATLPPFRLTYPQSLQTLNGDNRASAAQGLSDGDTIFSKLFWDNN